MAVFGPTRPDMAPSDKTACTSCVAAHMTCSTLYAHVFAAHCCSVICSALCRICARDIRRVCVQGCRIRAQRICAQLRRFTRLACAARTRRVLYPWTHNMRDMRAAVRGAYMTAASCLVHRRSGVAHALRAHEAHEERRSGTRGARTRDALSLVERHTRCAQRVGDASVQHIRDR